MIRVSSMELKKKDTLEEMNYYRYLLGRRFSITSVDLINLFYSQQVPKKIEAKYCKLTLFLTTYIIWYVLLLYLK